MIPPLFNKILNGISQFDSELIRREKLTTQLSIVSIAMTVGFNLFYIFYDFLVLKKLIYFNFICIFAYSIVCLTNRLNFHTASKVLFLVILNSQFFILPWFLSVNSGLQLLYFVSGTAAFLIFSKAEKRFLGFFALIPIPLYLIAQFKFKAGNSIIIIPPEILQIIYLSISTCVMMAIPFIVLLFYMEVVRTENLLKIEHKKTEKAYSLLSKYVAPQLSKSITDGEIDKIWQHNRKKLTLFFSDIKDFTKTTDSLEPEDMANILNGYLTEMNKIIVKYQGTLAQVIGDGLYVFFGAPKETNDEDHALRCIKMAIDMQTQMTDLNKKWFKTGLDKELKIRCGINTGMATVGGYGSSDRKEYTAMGMQVNIAARIESACEPGQVTMNHSTYVLVKNHIPCIEKDEIKVKGYHRPIKIYEVDLNQTNFCLL